MGDVGGLDGILTSIAIIFLNKYNTLSLKSILLTKLYKSSSDKYQKKRKDEPDPTQKPIKREMFRDGVVSDF